MYIHLSLIGWQLANQGASHYSQSQDMKRNISILGHDFPKQFCRDGWINIDQSQQKKETVLGVVVSPTYTIAPPPPSASSKACWDVVYLCWQYRPLIYESKCGGWGWGEGCWSFPMSTAVHITWHGAQINFGDLPPYLSYESMVWIMFTYSSGEGRDFVTPWWLLPVNLIFKSIFCDPLMTKLVSFFSSILKNVHRTVQYIAVENVGRLFFPPLH